MEPVDLPLDPQELSYYLYGGQQEFEKFVNTKNLKDKFDFLKFRPENYTFESPQHLAEEGKVLIELIKLHKANKLNLKTLSYLGDITPYARTLDNHFNLFKNIATSFASPKTAPILQNLIDKINIVGSVLLQEFDFTRNLVEDKVETLATVDASGRIILNTPANRAKFCRHFTPHSTHVLVYARIKTSADAKPSAPYPFFVPLRDPQTLELSKGVTMKWFGPSFGGISGREYGFEFKDFVIESDKILLDKYLGISNNKVEVKGDDMTINFTTRLCLLMQQDQAVERSIREAMKAAFITVRHSNNRTQFQTLDEKGKERPIFEYNFNKTRIMKGLAEVLNLQTVSHVLRRSIYMSIGNPVKNFQRLSSMAIFYDMFEAHVNERCLIVIESFREALGGIGYLKYSGIPTLQENAIKNAVLTGPTKDLRYLKFAQYFVNIDFNNPDQFMAPLAGWLTDSPEMEKLERTEDFNHQSSFFSFFFAKRLLHYRKKLLETHNLKSTDNAENFLKTITNFDLFNKVCENFMAYLKSLTPHTRLGLNLNRENQRLLIFLLSTDMAASILEDVPFYLSNEGKLWPENSLSLFNQDLAWYIDSLGKKSVQIVECFGFDENLLHSCIAKTADETYEKMFNMSKNHNPRNDPKIQDEIRKDLLKFLNRPANPKL
jgi:hypothetical protein